MATLGTAAGCSLSICKNKYGGHDLRQANINQTAARFNAKVQNRPPAKDYEKTDGRFYKPKSQSSIE